VRRVYAAGPLGFSAATRPFHDEVLVPALRARGFEVLDPWAGGAAIEAALAVPDPAARLEALRSANASVAEANASMIASCDAVFAVLDGTDVDSGTAAEIGYACALGRPVVGWRGDLRSAGDNEGAVVNLQVQWFVERSGGRIERTLEAALDALVEVAGGED
jgi:nucleoside 2-deoxyribosyltransferase